MQIDYNLDLYQNTTLYLASGGDENPCLGPLGQPQHVDRAYRVRLNKQP